MVFHRLVEHNTLSLFTFCNFVYSEQKVMSDDLFFKMERFPQSDLPRSQESQELVNGIFGALTPLTEVRRSIMTLSKLVDNDKFVCELTSTLTISNTELPDAKHLGKPRLYFQIEDGVFLTIQEIIILKNNQSETTKQSRPFVRTFFFTLSQDKLSNK